MERENAIDYRHETIDLRYETRDLRLESCVLSGFIGKSVVSFVGAYCIRPGRAQHAPTIANLPIGSLRPIHQRFTLVPSP